MPEGIRNQFLKEAQRLKDPHRTAVCRPTIRLACQKVQWQWVLGRISRVHLPADRRAALVGVMVGDAVPEMTPAKWNGGDGKCA